MRVIINLKRCVIALIDIIAVGLPHYFNLIASILNHIFKILNAPWLKIFFEGLHLIHIILHALLALKSLFSQGIIYHWLVIRSSCFTIENIFSFATQHQILFATVLNIASQSSSAFLSGSHVG
jgi:hypothetical protein